jgi:hypothetical protein
VQTVDLLKRVYGGEKTAQEKLGSEHLCKAVLDCLTKFQMFLEEYHKEPNAEHYAIIAKEISRSSEFAAFKRKIVRDDPRLSVVFETEFKTQ